MYERRVLSALLILTLLLTPVAQAKGEENNSGCGCLIFIAGALIIFNMGSCSGYRRGVADASRTDFIEFAVSSGSAGLLESRTEAEHLAERLKERDISYQRYQNLYHAHLLDLVRDRPQDSRRKNAEEARYRTERDLGL